MNILIVGVSGFIGEHLYHALSQDGHRLLGCSRNKIADINWQKFDFNQTEEQWQQQLQGIELVINAVGIYQQSEQSISDQQGFTQVHNLGPRKLFAACKKNHIKVIQISALGAERDNPVTEFLRSKRNADQYLLSHEESDIVLYPGIVLGEHGRSTRQLSLLASLYCTPLVFGRQRKLPLISIYQLTECIKNTINHWPETSRAVVLVARPETMESLLLNLRHWMKLGKGHFFAIPQRLLKLVFYFFPALSVGAFNKQSLIMLADYSDKQSNQQQSIEKPIQETASESLVKHPPTKRFKQEILTKLLFYLNLFVLGVIWFVSGLSSLINMEQSRELISLIGIKGDMGDMIISSAASADILLGILLWLSLWQQGLRKWVIYCQIGVMVTYSIIVSIMLPIFWLHPFAPIVKNLAVLLLAMYLLVEQVQTHPKREN